jgi:uncharacterized coiled-coil protein SlyX
MNVTEYRAAAVAQSINTVLTGLLVMGIGWLLLEVTGGRERWARIEERISAQQVNIMELRSDINAWNANLQNSDKNLRNLELRIHALEVKVEGTLR